MDFNVFDVSPSDPGVKHPSFGVVLLSSQVSDPNLYLSPGPDQIWSKSELLCFQKAYDFLAISMCLF